MSLGWWAISGEDLLAMLQEVAAGNDPDVTYAEWYANCGHFDVGGLPEASAEDQEGTL